MIFATYTGALGVVARPRVARPICSNLGVYRTIPFTSSSSSFSPNSLQFGCSFILGFHCIYVDEFSISPFYSIPFCVT
ncbi:unnamed protein product [Citrullus colocynthis]|uniref:Uncharacterized protein n=1 Tax=Citrullus colocynthis TaxID=252529 RepID=A0ABP0XL82_9ROSI